MEPDKFASFSTVSNKADETAIVKKPCTTVEESVGRNFDPLRVLNEHVSLTVKCKPNRKKLAKIVQMERGAVRVNNKSVGNFIAMKEHVLVEMLTDAAREPEVSPSFFDGMDMFKAGDHVGLDALKKVSLPGEYTQDTLDSLSKVCIKF